MQKSRYAKGLWRVARVALLSYLGALLLLMYFEESLVFLPTKHHPADDWNPPSAVESVEFTAADGTRLHGWFAAHPQPRAVILHCAGNAGNLAQWAYRVPELVDQLGCSLLLFDYRGYGRSEGAPNELGVLQDARAARAWLAQRAGVAETDIVLIGRSLGGGVAVDLAARDGARGLILESTFSSLPEAAAVHYPWAPVRLLMRTRFDSAAKIAAYHQPLLQCHGDADEVVPLALGQRLHEAAPSPDKKFLLIPGGHHNDPQPNWWLEEIDEFLDRLPVNATAGQ